MVPGFTDSTVVGLVAEILRSVEPVAKERSLSDRVLLIGHSGGGKDTEAEHCDRGDTLGGDVHRW
jgi:hypothetical protein